MASWTHKWSLCVERSMTKSTACSRHWHTTWRPFYINKRGQHYRVPALSWVVVWQLCTFGSLLINQRAHVPCSGPHSACENMDTQRVHWSAPAGVESKRENGRSDQSKLHRWRSSLFTVVKSRRFFLALWMSTVASVMSAFQSRLSLTMRFDEQGADIQCAEVTRCCKCETRPNTWSPNKKANTGYCVLQVQSVSCGVYLASGRKKKSLLAHHGL